MLLSAWEDVGREKISNEAELEKKIGNNFITDKRINIPTIKMLSESAIKKCLCVIGDFSHPSEWRAKTFEVNLESLQLSTRTN